MRAFTAVPTITQSLSPADHRSKPPAPESGPSPRRPPVTSITTIACRRSKPPAPENGPLLVETGPDALPASKGIRHGIELLFAKEVVVTVLPLTEPAWIG